MIDLTPILQAVLGLLAALITYKVIPWIKAKTDAQTQSNLAMAAKVAVFAAEQIFLHGDNSAKLEYAISRLQDAGFKLERSALKQAVEAAVHELKGAA